ncbi:CaiB/BaiF CoA transferase family protein [Paradesulfitobacterium ferrireducens]|uniref:CaiB/BaiF CoA transferase family protein n=1 Tax=Paradesulfitobacterium ferrireducens TaxID=2816476 RepID=UPI001A8C735D|nr:CaiB/BaiF CoA-transferase family protein [Paradesulfitobacterium ferrireducens]
MNQAEGNIFNNLRIVELAGELGAYTGKLYADLGAEVIRVESLEGDPTRREKPFYKDVPGTENGLRYQYLNTNKKGIVLDITTPEGKEAFLKLIPTIDLLIESFAPGYLESLGLGYETLSSLNPKLVHTAITPYGQYGPYKDYPYSDLTTMAMGGMLFLAGADNDKPALAPDKQSFFQADLYAALGSMLAVMHADLTSEGQFIDVSIQESVATALENAIQTYDLEGRIRRAAGAVEAGYGTYTCQDGHVYVMAAMGRNTHLWDPLVKWLLEEKIPNAEVLQGEEWQEPDYRKKEEAKDVFKEIFEQFSARYPKNVLYEESQKRNVVIYPVNNAKDVLENFQLYYRNYFREMYSESIKGKLTYPGPPYSLEKLPWALKSSAPAFGQHTVEVLSELGYSIEEIKSMGERGVSYAK